MKKKKNEELEDLKDDLANIDTRDLSDNLASAGDTDDREEFETAIADAVSNCEELLAQLEDLQARL